MRQVRAQVTLFAPLVQAALAHLGDGLILDVGCGDGTLLGEQATVGVDIDINALRAARRATGRNAFAVADVEQLPIRNGAAGAIFVFSMLQYPDRQTALGELARVLRPDGRIAVIENLEGSPIARLYRIWRRLRGIAYPPFLTPRKHLRWPQRTVFERFFSSVRYEAHHLFAPLAYLGLGPRTIRALQAVDRLLLRVPPLRHLAWHAVITGSKTDAPVLDDRV